MLYPGSQSGTPRSLQIEPSVCNFLKSLSIYAVSANYSWCFSDFYWVPGSAQGTFPAFPFNLGGEKKVLTMILLLAACSKGRPRSTQGLNNCPRPPTQSTVKVDLEPKWLGYTAKAVITQPCHFSASKWGEFQNGVHSIHWTMDEPNYCRFRELETRTFKYWPYYFSIFWSLHYFNYKIRRAGQMFLSISINESTILKGHGSV